MKKFIIGVVKFIIPLFIFSIVLEISLRSISNNYSYKSQYLLKNAKEVNTLILGNSHSFYGLNPDYFSVKTFNAAQVSQSLYFDYEILKKHEQDLVNLKTIIIPLSYFSLSFNLGDSKEPWRAKNYLIYYEMGGDKLSYYETLLYNSELLSNKFENNIQRLLNFIKDGTSLTCNELGWGNNFSSKNAVNLEKSSKINSLRHNSQVNSPVARKNFKMNSDIIDSILSFAKKRSIEVILFTPPAYVSYRDKIDTSKLNQTINFANNITMKYKNTTYINFFDDSRFVATDYYDADHLSEVGAQKLSKLMNSKLSLLSKNSNR